jgi:hypothetical protein
LKHSLQYDADTMGPGFRAQQHGTSASISPLIRLSYILLILPLLFASSLQSPLAQDASAKKMATNPVIVLVPGAWHSPIHYGALIKELNSQGYMVTTDKLPSVGSSTPKDQSVANDSKFIKSKLLTPLLDAGRDILLLMHSYGGCPGADAAKGLSKSERAAAGKTGGIVGLIFMCAFVANEGDSLKSKLPNEQYDPWVVWNVSIIISRKPGIAALHILELNSPMLIPHRRKQPSSLSAAPKMSSTTMSMTPSLRRLSLG